MAGPAAFSPSAGVLSTVFRCSGTAVSRLMFTADFWLFFGMHLMLFGWMMFRHGRQGVHQAWSPSDQDEIGFLDWAKHQIDWNMIQVVLFATILTQCCYLNQCCRLYLDAHELMRSMLADVYDSAHLLRGHIQPKGCPPYDRVALRWMVTTVLLFFYEARHGGVDDSHWDKLVACRLVTKEEAEFLSTLTDGQRFLVTMHCVADCAKTGLKAAKVPPNVEADVIKRLLQYGNTRNNLMDTLRAPVPFAYFHCMNFMVMITLFVWGFALATTYHMMAPVFYFGLIVFFMGSMDATYHLNNPFTSSDADAYLSFWVTEFMQNMVPLVELDLGLIDGWRPELDMEPAVMARQRLLQTDFHDVFNNGMRPIHTLPPGVHRSLRQAKLGPSGPLPPASKEATHSMAHKSPTPSLPPGGIMAPVPTPQEEQKRPLLGREDASFEQMDKNKDGVITRAEFQAASGEQPQGATFDQIDRDHDGIITREEIRDHAFNQADANNDGVITREEYRAASGGQGPAFDELDKDHDGVITREEYQGHHTTLVHKHFAGEKILRVASHEGFAVGDDITISHNGMSETRTIIGIGSLILDAPLLNTYPAGATVKKAAERRKMPEPPPVTIHAHPDPPPQDDIDSTRRDVQRQDDIDSTRRDVQRQDDIDSTRRDVQRQESPLRVMGQELARAGEPPTFADLESEPEGAPRRVARRERSPSGEARSPPWESRGPGLRELSAAASDLRTCMVATGPDAQKARDDCVGSWRAFLQQPASQAPSANSWASVQRPQARHHGDTGAGVGGGY